MKKRPQPGPGSRLAKLIENGDAYIQENHVYGIAFDGVIMVLGSARNAKDFEEIEKYLKEYPTPEDW